MLREFKMINSLKKIAHGSHLFSKLTEHQRFHQGDSFFSHRVGFLLRLVQPVALPSSQ